MKELNLQWGQPQFLHPFWKDKLRIMGGSEEGLLYANDHKLLPQAILDLHHMEQNVAEGDYEVVIGNGASQVLQAAIYATEAAVAWAKPPYFNRFPLFAQLAGATWGYEVGWPSVQIVTIPNNPDGSTGKGYSITNKKSIYDLCYNWRQYTNPKAFNKDIMVFSLAKAFGFAGTRVGWALVKDKETAKKMRQFIENQTCGVSFEAQEKAYCIISYHLLKLGDVMDFGRKELDNRWKQINGKVVCALSNSGMFLWTGTRDFYEARGIIGIGGEQFGGTKEQLRINLGGSMEDHEEFVRRITCS